MAKKKVNTIIRYALFLILIILVFGTIAYSYTKVAPQFGERPEGDYLSRINNSPNYDGNQFINLIETSTGSLWDVLPLLPELLFSEQSAPTKPLETHFETILAKKADSLCHITWLGHSAFLIELEGKRILIDPMLTENPSPLPIGTKRFPYESPIPIEKLNDIDAIILSHDHYDHLDYPSILQLKEVTKHFYAPLGVGAHLSAWGIPASKITELDWWEEAKLNSIEIIASPSRHFSGRGLTDRNKTQWASWIIKSENTSIYFSGDGGYGPHFKEIGKRHGPFDLALMECGQYNDAWPDIHMLPEQSVTAGKEVKGKILMPIHWGAFSLSTHSWTEPVTRFKKEIEQLNMTMIHPVIGQRVQLGKDYPKEEWWLKYMDESSH
ncbi:MBL fold metallo-hydrolase [Echinicola salinicaeni]|uniref:MBL fold metallo-hydrolase n=1 Tax=Echinicola salinicaeni TaxID=2762757 RepID=UPI0016450B52|nr:MBL fold metallo-hydrolase [Echinicola salinicaeni]